MSQYRKAPSGEWLGYPKLSAQDIEQESLQHLKHITRSLIDNRKGRVILVMEHEDHSLFLDAVRKKFGDISASNIEKATLEAVKAWTERATL